MWRSSLFIAYWAETGVTENRIRTAIINPDATRCYRRMYRFSGVNACSRLSLLCMDEQTVCDRTPLKRGGLDSTMHEVRIFGARAEMSEMSEMRIPRNHCLHQCLCTAFSGSNHLDPLGGSPHRMEMSFRVSLVLGQFGCSGSPTRWARERGNGGLLG